MSWHYILGSLSASIKLGWWVRTDPPSSGPVDRPVVTGAAVAAGEAVPFPTKIKIKVEGDGQERPSHTRLQA